MRHKPGYGIAIGALILLPSIGAMAQSPPAPAMQAGIGPTGTMYNGNNLQRAPVGRAPPPPPQAGGGGVTGTSTGGASGDSTGGGAGGGEH